MSDTHCRFCGTELVDSDCPTCHYLPLKACEYLRGRIEGARANARMAAQILIEEVGADGPMSVHDVAEKAVGVIQRLRKSVNTLERQLEEAIEDRDAAEVDLDTMSLPQNQGGP